MVSEVYGIFRVRNKEKEEEALFKKNLLSSEQYTLKIAGFKKITNIWLYINDLISHLQTVKKN